MTNQFDPAIFKSYDIRGIYPDQINGDFAYLFGRAFVTWLNLPNPTIGISRDMRLSSSELTNQLIKGLLDQGANVINLGLLSTPSLYFAVSKYSYHAGVQVTASHNPSEYNGLKPILAKAVPVSKEGLEEIKSIVLSGQFSQATTPGNLSTKTDIPADLVADQSQQWLIDFSSIKPLKIVFDASNAMGSQDAEAIFTKTNCQLVKLNFDLDGSFPNHLADTLQEVNLSQLKQTVLDQKADLGIMTDGDGDRVVFVNELGQVIPQHILRGIIAQLVLKDYPGATICYDIRPGRITKDMIEQAGGKPSVTRVGHTFIKQQMLAENAPYGGESSGHYFFKFSYGSFESPAVLIWKFLEYISQQNKPVSQITAPYDIYFQSGEINSEVEDKDAKIAQIKEKYSDGQINEMDGLTIEYPDYWFNVRKSGTEPLLRLNLEAKTKEIMESKRDEIITLIRS